MRELDWKQAAAVTVTLVGGGLALYVVGRYVLLLLLPFLIAFALALITRPAVLRLGRRMPEKWAAVLVTALALCGVGVLGYLLFSRLLSEVRALVLFLVRDSEDPEGRIATWSACLRRLWESLPLVGEGGTAATVQGFLSQQLLGAVTQLSQRLADLAVALAGALPSVLLFLLVTVISCFYFAAEYGAVGRTVARLVPPRLRGVDWRGRAGLAIRRYIRAYLLLFLLTVAELLVGFLILRIHYAFLLALLTAVLDILPVLGVGTVLLPYALFSFAVGNGGLGVGLLVLYAVITVLRQIAEPRLVGKSLGLHPIPMLISFYVGLRLFGVAGVLLGPFMAMVIKSFWERKGDPARAE